MSPKFVEEHGIPLQKKKQSYGLSNFEGIPMTYNNGQVMHHTRPVTFRLGRHWEKMKFDITEISGNDVILGIL